MRQRRRKKELPRMAEMWNRTKEWKQRLITILSPTSPSQQLNRLQGSDVGHLESYGLSTRTLLRQTSQHKLHWHSRTQADLSGYAESLTTTGLSKGEGQTLARS